MKTKEELVLLLTGTIGVLLAALLQLQGLLGHHIALGSAPVNMYALCGPPVNL